MLGFFLLSFFCSPLIGIIVALIISPIKKDEEEDERFTVKNKQFNICEHCDCGHVNWIKISNVIVGKCEKCDHEYIIIN
jgi:hypothetical protein